MHQLCQWWKEMTQSTTKHRKGIVYKPNTLEAVQSIVQVVQGVDNILQDVGRCFLEILLNNEWKPGLNTLIACLLLRLNSRMTTRMSRKLRWSKHRKDRFMAVKPRPLFLRARYQQRHRPGSWPSWPGRPGSGRFLNEGSLKRPIFNREDFPLISASLGQHQYNDHDPCWKSIGELGYWMIMHDFPHCPGVDQMNPRAGWLQWRDWNLGDRGRPRFGSQKVCSWPESYGLRPQGTSSWRGVELNFSSFLVDFLFPDSDGYQRLATQLLLNHVLRGRIYKITAWLKKLRSALMMMLTRWK